MRPHPKRGAVTQMLPGRSPGSRITGRINFDSATGPRLPIRISTVANCESSSRLQWRYRSGFSPLSLLVPETEKQSLKTPGNHKYSINYTLLRPGE